MPSRSTTALLTGLALLAAGMATPAAAAAACKKFSFLVNDYGKDGPTKDAKDLLDKYIGEWMKEKGISKWTVGNKDVKCELFLNLIVVDEHTCTATASACWDDSAPKSPIKAKAAAKN
jgi:hypothetical protein